MQLNDFGKCVHGRYIQCAGIAYWVVDLMSPVQFPVPAKALSFVTPS